MDTISIASALPTIVTIGDIDNPSPTHTTYIKDRFTSFFPRRLTMPKPDDYTRKQSQGVLFGGETVISGRYFL
jgi:hypothetical protein